MKLPLLVHNRISYLGTVIAALAAIVFGFLFVLHTVTGRRSCLRLRAGGVRSSGGSRAPADTTPRLQRWS